jgi:alpha-D-xyloside xylohydrolase
MFGPSLLIAPVTDQGRTTRQVYLPAGTDWYNFWTNERVHGGQSVAVDAPIDIIPVFVKAGAILPMGSAVESTNEAQKVASLRVYPGADGMFELYRDDGTTYDYEQGKFELTQLHWSDTAGKLSKSGAALDAAVEVVAVKR